MTLELSLYYEGLVTGFQSSSIAALQNDQRRNRLLSTILSQCSKAIGVLRAQFEDETYLRRLIMFDRIVAYFQAARQSRRLSDEFASMSHRDYVDIGINAADVPAILEENFKRLFAQALEARLALRGQAVTQTRVA